MSQDKINGATQAAADALVNVIWTDEAQAKKAHEAVTEAIREASEQAVVVTKCPACGYKREIGPNVAGIIKEAERRGRAEGREEAAKVVEAPITAHKESAEAARRMLATPLAAHHQSLYVAIRDSERTKAETLEWAAVEIRAIAKRITEAGEGNDGK